MPLETAWSGQADDAVAFAGAYGTLRNRLGGDPGFVVAAFNEKRDARALRDAVSLLPEGVRVLGLRTCRGILTEEGPHLTGPVLGLLGLSPDAGRFGIGMRTFGPDPRSASSQALLSALDDAGRPGELPDLILIAVSAGSEERVLAGIADVLGQTVPLCGGSAYGDGAVLSRHTALPDAVAVAVAFIATPVSQAFQAGCIPLGRSGVVTRVEGRRRIVAIDGRPAARVYAEWFAASAGRALPAGDAAVPAAVPYPLGRRIDSRDGMSSYRVSALAEISEAGLLAMTDIAPGDRVMMMTAVPEDMLVRSGRIAAAAIAMQHADSGKFTGALVTICAGLQGRIVSRLPRSHSALTAAMQGRPFLAIFTNGEQGCPFERGAVHSNLMVGVLTFGV